MASNRRGKQKRHPGKSASPPRLRAETLRMLKREAKNLGLTTEEYMRMVLNLSSTLRKGLVEEDKVDARKLLQWVDNPLMLSMVQWVCRYALKSMDTADDASDSDSPVSLPETESPVQSPPHSQQPQGHSPNQVWIDPWGNVLQAPPPGLPHAGQRTAPPPEPTGFEEGYF